MRTNTEPNAKVCDYVMSLWDGGWNVIYRSQVEEAGLLLGLRLNEEISETLTRVIFHVCMHAYVSLHRLREINSDIGTIFGGLGSPCETMKKNDFPYDIRK